MASSSCCRAYWISVYPGIALMITVVAINLVGDQVRYVLNPRRSR
jgi:peptide/nickel transport system permease protein